MAEADNSKSERPLRAIDLCTGTGCISLLLHALLASQFQNLSITGIDISPMALSLAQKNLQHNLQLGQLAPRAMTDIHFHQADVLGNGSDSTPPIEPLLQSLCKTGSESSEHTQCDLLISNPPYISRTEFRNGTTARSVRLFEPELALVPPDTVSGDCRPEDIFYHRIIKLAFELEAKITVLECGDMAQAQRVVALHKQLVSSPRGFSAEVWPKRECDLAKYGFHETDGSRCVIIQRLP
jgi:methylase of polypeptide subunit release factors